MSDAPRTMGLTSIRVDRNLISHVKWLLEAHDGMATPTTREGTDDVIDLLVAPGFEEELALFVEALVDEMGAEIVEPPETHPLGG